jgi:nicotinamidase/pyrazinamidase
MNILSEHIASFDIDAQKTFTPLCPDELPVPEGTAIVDELNKQAQFAQYRIGSKDAHSPQAIWVADKEHPAFTPIKGDNVDIRWPVHAVPGTKGFESIAGLPKVTEYDYFVWKGVELDLHPYGACYHDFKEHMSTGLIEYLHYHGIKLIIAGGLATDYCVKTTVLQLLRAGFKVIVNLAACRGITPATTEKAIAEMKKTGAIMVQSADELPHLLEYSIL